MNAYESNIDDLQRLHREAFRTALRLRHARLNGLDPNGPVFKRLKAAQKAAQSEYEQLLEYCHCANRLIRSN